MSPYNHRMITSILGRVSAGEDLSMADMELAIGKIMDGACSEGEIATLLTALAHKGETVEEIAGAAKAMRAHMTPIASSRTGVFGYLRHRRRRLAAIQR